jgi:flagellar FliJ protein
MTATFTLKKVQEVADIRTDAAAANLGAMMQHLQRQEAKLALLLQYRDEYQERLRRAKQRGLDGLALRNFHDFLDRLEHALIEQRTTVEHAQRSVARGQDEWRSADQRSRAYDTLSQRFDSVARRRAEATEQKQQDAHAARLTSSKI